MVGGKRPRIAIILGSARKGSGSACAMEIILHELAIRPAADVEMIDPRVLDLKLHGKELDSKLSLSLQHKMMPCAGVIMITPEYDGSYSSTIKLIIEHLGYPSVLAGKPISLVGVASGKIGAVKALEHLRSVCGSIGAIPLPWSLSIPSVHALFASDGACLDKDIEKDLRDAARQLLAYLNMKDSK